MSPENYIAKTLTHRINLLPPELVREQPNNEPNRKYGLQAKLGRVSTAFLLAAGSFGAGAIYREANTPTDTIELAGAMAYDNSLIAETAKKYVGRNGSEACKDDKLRVSRTGECRAFVNCIVSQVTDSKQKINGGEAANDYFMPFFKAGGMEIKSINNLAKGDIVQEFKNGDKIHTYIIFKPISGSTFEVVDSNQRKDEIVRMYPRRVTLDSNKRAFRMGQVKEAVEQVDVNKFKGQIVKWDNGPGKQPTSWLVGDDLKRYWIKDTDIYWCLRNRGTPDAGPQPAKVLDQLPDNNGQWAQCETLKPPATQKKFPTTYNAKPKPSPYAAARHITSTPTPMQTAPYASPAPSPQPSPQPSPAAPQPSPSPSKRLYPEQQGSRGANTFSNPYNASGFGPRKVTPGEWVDVECKVYAPQTPSANPDGYWYRLYSSPWDSQYYAVANTFMNGDPWGGPYNHNTDFNVPDC